MNRYKKISIWVMGIMGCLLALLLVSLFLLPRFINREVMREKIQDAISQRVKGEVAFRRIDFSLFPRPVVGINQMSLSIPGTLSGTVGSVAVFPKIVPLLQGKVRIAALHFEAPTFNMVLPERREGQEGELNTFFPEKIKEKLAALAAPAGSGLVVQIRNGALSLSEGQETRFRFKDIQSEMRGSSEKLALEWRCASSLWESMSLEGRFNLTDSNGDGHISLKGFQPEDLAGYLPIPSTYSVGESLMDLEISAKTEKLETFHAEVQGSLPSLVVSQGKKKVVFTGKNMQGTVDAAADTVHVSLNDLELDSPRIILSGDLRVDRLSPRISLALEGKEVDAAAVREAALALAGEIPIVQRIFSIVKGGTIPLITFSTEGSAGGELKKLENMVVKGTMEGGNVFIPEEASGVKDTSFDLQDVKGDVVISQGVLEAKNLRGRWENAQMREGALKLGLQGKDRPFHLEATLTTDLGQVPPLLKRIIKDSQLVEEFAAISDIKGTALGKLTMGETIGSLKVAVDVSQINLTARYKRLPYPLEVSEGRYSYNDEEIRISNLRGKLGKSSFSGLTAKIALGKEHDLEISSGNLTLSLIQIHQWLSSFENLHAALKDLNAVQGTLMLSEVKLGGPVSRPKAWQFDVTGEVKNLLVDTPLCPGPLSVGRGKLRATSRKLAFTGARIGLLDGSIQASGTIHGYLEGVHKAAATFEGKVGEEVNQWVSTLMSVPPTLKIHAPFLISDARVGWERNGKSLFSGTIVPDEGPAVSLDVTFGPHEVALDQLHIKDEKSDATVSLLLKERAFDFAFRGNLEEASIDRLLVENQILAGWIRGDLKGHILMDEPVKSTARGTLEGADLGYPVKLHGLAQPEIDSFSVDAAGNSIDVKSALISIGGKHLNLSGHMDFSLEKFLFAMDVSVDGIEWDELQQIINEEEDKGDGDEGAEKVEGFPVEGVLKVKSDYFKYKELEWSPVHADISVSLSGVAIAITEANLCGVSFPGEVHTTPEGLSVAFQPVSQTQQMDPFVNCLFGKSKNITGEFNFQGSVTAQGKGLELLDSLRGTGEFLARDGRIYHDILLVKIYQHLNTTDVFRGKFGGIGKEGFAFDTISVKTNLEGKKLIISEAFMDGTSMEMTIKGTIDLDTEKIDCRALVAPVKTIDRVVKMIPWVGRALGGTLITVPVRITGELGSPKVSTISPTAIGSDLLGTIKKVADFPVKVIQPAFSKDKKKTGSSQNN